MTVVTEVDVVVVVVVIVVTVVAVAVVGDVCKAVAVVVVKGVVYPSNCEQNE